MSAKFAIKCKSQVKSTEITIRLINLIYIIFKIFPSPWGWVGLTGEAFQFAVLKNVDILYLLISVSGLECFSDVLGFQQTHCSSARGFKTCFTKINNGKSGPPSSSNCFLNITEIAKIIKGQIQTKYQTNRCSRVTRCMISLEDEIALNWISPGECLLAFFKHETSHHLIYPVTVKADTHFFIWTKYYLIILIKSNFCQNNPPSIFYFLLTS